jgi:hypothetical protein
VIEQLINLILILVPMFVNNFKINLSTFDNSSATTINVPIAMEYQLVDQGELINRVFVDVETKKAINPIIDYERVRFIPIDNNNNEIKKITYNLDLNGGTTYGEIGFTYDDIKFRKGVFKQSFLNLEFYDTNIPLTQNLVAIITLFSELRTDNLMGFNSAGSVIGQPLPANQIPISFVLDNKVNLEGFYLYDFKDEITVNNFKYLYMRASFKNAKTGKSTNLMVKNTPLPIDTLINELYTRYKLIRNSDGYFYVIDETYQSNQTNTNQPNNVTYGPQNSVNINLYQIQAL